jgi:uncharacterized protein (DUF2062 family)
MAMKLIKEWGIRQFKFRILHVEDSAHRIALAVALAVAIAWTPAVGLHLLIYLLLAWLCRANVLVGIPFILLSNPLTLIPIYYPNYLIGRAMLGITDPPGNFLEAISFNGDFITVVQTWWGATAPYAGPLWLGSIVMAIPAGALVYGLIFRSVRKYQKNHPELAQQAADMTAAPEDGRAASPDTTPTEDIDTP